jgi:hypothetical protein
MLKLTYSLLLPLAFCLARSAIQPEVRAGDGSLDKILGRTGVRPQKNL